jgi:hypothetical protein
VRIEIPDEQVKDFVNKVGRYDLEHLQYLMT